MKPFAFALKQTAVAIPASSLPPPVISYLGGTQWRLVSDYFYRDGAHLITIFAPFDFDLASIPRVFWSLIAPFELSVVAPLFHDFLYRYKGMPPPGAITPPRTYSRKETDVLFHHLMGLEGVRAWRRYPAYRAVRWFGWAAWNRLPASHAL